MKKAVRNILNIGLYLLIGVVVASLIRFGEYIYYYYSPVENFVKIEKLDFQNYKQGSETQLLLSYRNSKVDSIGDFYYKFFCGGITKLEWSYNTPNIFLGKTDGLKIIKVEMPALDLPKGECEVQSKVIIHIKEFQKEIYLEDTFLVY